MSNVVGSPDPNSESQKLVTIDQPRRQYRVGDNVDVLCKGRSGDIRLQWLRLGTNQYVASLVGTTLHYKKQITIRYLY